MPIVSQMLAIVCSHGLGLICLGLFFYHWRNYWLFVLHTQLDMEDGDEIDAMLHQTGGMALWPQVYFGRHYGSGILLYVMPFSNVFWGLFLCLKLWHWQTKILEVTPPKYTQTDGVRSSFHFSWRILVLVEGWLPFVKSWIGLYQMCSTLVVILDNAGKQPLSCVYAVWYVFDITSLGRCWFLCIGLVLATIALHVLHLMTVK